MAESGNGSTSSPLRSTLPSFGVKKEPPQKKMTEERRVMQGYVGFADIPNQVYRKAVRRGFHFTLMVVGQGGLGKSTFINSLFLTDIYPAQHGQQCRKGETVQIEEQRVKLVEKNVSVDLTLVDTPGFGDALDNSHCWDPILDYVDGRCQDYFTEETKVDRPERIADRRVHCCLYFISPSGHGLKPLDLEFMRRLHERVNLVPVIAKADTMTVQELRHFKQKILSEIREAQIKIYDFPDADESDENQNLQPLKARVPFAVIGSSLVRDVGAGKKVRCREYPWGTVEEVAFWLGTLCFLHQHLQQLPTSCTFHLGATGHVIKTIFDVENLEHNDYIALRDMVIRTHLVDLIDVTESVHYENFRCHQLLQGSCKSLTAHDRDPFTVMEEEKSSHEVKLDKELENMERVFNEKVREKQEAIEVREKEMAKALEELQAALAAKQGELQEKQRALQAAYQQTSPALNKHAGSNLSVSSENRTPPDSEPRPSSTLQNSAKKWAQAKGGALHVFSKSQKDKSPDVSRH